MNDFGFVYYTCSLLHWDGLFVTPSLFLLWQAKMSAGKTADRLRINENKWSSDVENCKKSLTTATQLFEPHHHAVINIITIIIHNCWTVTGSSPHLWPYDRVSAEHGPGLGVGQIGGRFSIDGQDGVPYPQPAILANRAPMDHTAHQHAWAVLDSTHRRPCRHAHTRAQTQTHTHTQAQVSGGLAKAALNACQSDRQSPKQTPDSGIISIIKTDTRQISTQTRLHMLDIYTASSFTVTLT